MWFVNPNWHAGFKFGLCYQNLFNTRYMPVLWNRRCLNHDVGVFCSVTLSNSCEEPHILHFQEKCRLVIDRSRFASPYEFGRGGLSANQAPRLFWKPHALSRAGLQWLAGRRTWPCLLLVCTGHIHLTAGCMVMSSAPQCQVPGWLASVILRASSSLPSAQAHHED